MKVASLVELRGQGVPLVVTGDGQEKCYIFL